MRTAVGLQREERENRTVTGRYQKVAVDCWFTSTGETIPRMIKYQDERGELHLLRDIQVQKTNRRRCGGMLLQRYDCRGSVGGRLRKFTLLYHPGENTWDMVL